MEFEFTEYFYNKIQRGEIIDAEDIKKVLISLGLINQNQNCPGCHFSMRLHIDRSKANGLRFYCTTCQKNCDIRRFTPFTGFRLVLVDILRVVALFAEEKGLTVIIDETGLASATVSKIIYFCRSVIKMFIDDTQPQLGEDSIVEIDETVIARRKYNRGRLVQQQWLFRGYRENWWGDFT